MAPAAASAWALARAGAVLDGEPVTSSFGWVPELGLSVDLRLDSFALLMVSLVAGIGVLVFAYAYAYFGDRAGLGRFAGLLTGFAGAMLGLVLADNLLALYVFWELTSVTSYLLIGFDDEKATARAAALQAILVTGVGGLAMLGGFVAIGLEAGTFRLSEILASPPSGTVVDAALVLVLLGALTKSAQVPFHSWLPGAMAAPTPVSAYLHSATMVKAGVYLVARLAPAFAEAPTWRPIVVTLGLATMLIGGLRALRQHDLKLLLAHGTTSQLGFLMVLFGLGLPEATLAGCGLLLAHGAFKAALFMGVGVVDHQAGTRDARRLDRIAAGPGWGPVLAVAAIGAASMAGVPLLFGFVTKESAYSALLQGGVGAGDPLVLAGVVAGSMLTFAYSARLVRALVSPAERGADAVGPAPAARLDLVGPALVLAGLTLVLGLLPGLASDLVSGAAASLDPEVEPVDLALWHGISAPLLLSLLTLAVGVALAARWRSVERVQDRTPPLPTAEGGYVAALRGVNGLADRTVAIVQSGSLPTYLATVLATVLALPGVALLSGSELGDLPKLSETPVQLAVAGLTGVAACAAAAAGQRIHAVLFLGAVGYGMAVLFVSFGAPDLALTQVLIETLSVAIFVLVLRRLPSRAPAIPWRMGRAVRLVVATSVGLFVAGFALVAGAARRASPVSDGFLERAYDEAGGRNVVNVILVDFRGLDTLGEITVLAVAALGIVSLAKAARSKLGEPATTDPDP